MMQRCVGDFLRASPMRPRIKQVDWTITVRQPLLLYRLSPRDSFHPSSEIASHTRFEPNDVKYGISKRVVHVVTDDGH